MITIIQAGQLFSSHCKTTRDERSSDSSHTGLIPLWMTNQNGQLKTLQRRTMTSLIILCLRLTKQAITAKGADCRRRTPETNTNKLPPTAPSPLFHPHTHNKTDTYCAHIAFSETNTWECTHTHFTFTVSLITRWNQPYIDSQNGREERISV